MGTINPMGSAKRVEIIDSLRGIAIIVVIFFHTDYYWNNNLTAAQYNAMLSNPASMIALTLGKFAGIFAIITGMAYTYSACNKIENKGKSASMITKSALISGFMVVIISKIQSIFLDHASNDIPAHALPNGTTSYTLITGSIATGKLQFPSHYTVFYSYTPLLMIGIAAIWTGLLLGLIFMHDGYQHHSRNFLVLGVIAASIILSSQLMKDYIRPFWLTAVVHDHIFSGIVLGIFVGDPFPFFPYGGYAVVGMMFGMAFYYDIKTKLINFWSVLFGGTGLGFGIYLFTIIGYPTIDTIDESPDIQMNLVLISSMIFISMLIYNIHYLPHDNRIRKAFNSFFLRRFGLVTLTIFMFEPIVGTAIKVVLLDRLFPNWSSNIVYIVIYSFFLIILWYYMIIAWEKKDFIWTWEWMNAKIIQVLSGQATMRLAIHDNLYYNDEEHR